MRGKIVKSSLMLSVMLASIVLGLAVMPVSATAYLSAPILVNPLQAPGSSLTIDILVNNVAYLTITEINLGFNPDMLEATVAGYRLVEVWFETDSVTIDNVGGNVHMIGHRRTTRVPPWLTTTFPLALAFVTFTVKDRGTSEFDLHDTVLTDYYGMTITHDEMDGSFDNRLQGTMAAPNIVDTTLTEEGSYFDVFVTLGPWRDVNLEKIWGFQFVMEFDPNIIVAIDFETLDIFMPGPSEIGADYVAVTGNSYYGDPNGMSTSVPVPVARIGFVVLAQGVTLLELRDTAMVDVNGADKVIETISGSFANTVNVSVSLNTIFVESRKWYAATDGPLFTLTAQVTNTGAGITMTRAIFEVYESGIMVDKLTTDEVDIFPGTIIRLDAELKVGPLAKDKSYRVVGTVEYISYMGAWVQGRKGSPTGARTSMVKTFDLYP